MRCLQLWYKGIHRRFGDKPQFKSRLVLVPLEIAPDLDHSRRAVTDRVNVLMGPKGLETTSYTDASLLGWGPSWAHINALEMEAVWKALQHFASFLIGRHVLIMTDSMTTKAYINCQGGMISGQCNELARCIWLWVAENAHYIRGLHLPGKNNNAADILSRGGPHAENWSLNPAIVELLWERFGTAQVDLFAAKANHKCPLWFSISLSNEAPLGLPFWPEGLLYSYPPYSCLGDLLERFERENVRMILVAPQEPNDSWFSGMRPWIRGERSDIPQWRAALSQANGLIIEHPYYRDVRLAAWMLTKPGA